MATPSREEYEACELFIQPFSTADSLQMIIKESVTATASRKTPWKVFSKKA